MREEIYLKEWTFSIKKLKYIKDVTIPHTWNIDEQVSQYKGKSKYSTNVFIDAKYFNKKVQIQFNAVFNSCKIYINKIYIGKHINSGYTPFIFDITKFIKFGHENKVEVMVDNSHRNSLLPHGDDFDWADDGGLIRTVKIIILNKNGIEYLNIPYEITNIIDKKCSGSLRINTNVEYPFIFRLKEYGTNKVVIEQEIFKNISIDFNNVKCWGCDNPHLYVAEIEKNDDIFDVNIGFRLIEKNGNKIYLNKEEIFLKGCEWMPGSNPDCGMAESDEETFLRLKELKDLGCNFTRFHWQQDDKIFDWLDMNGILVQEEIPYWGKPKQVSHTQIKIAKKQADEMLHFHFNHPSIIFWGVGNELDGSNKKTINYVEILCAYFKERDKQRLVNYVSNTLSLEKNINSDDATLHGDVAMWNDYLGLWEPTNDLVNHMKRTCAKAKEMPLIVSEFGLCEPQFKGGDPERCRILKERLALYKDIDNIAGFVFFSLNDYRTHCGEAGEGKLKQRVHGMTDLYDNKKSSYDLFKQLMKGK